MKNHHYIQFKVNIKKQIKLVITEWEDWKEKSINKKCDNIDIALLWKKIAVIFLFIQIKAEQWIKTLIIIFKMIK